MAVKIGGPQESEWFRRKLGKRPRGVDENTLQNTLTIDLAVSETLGLADLKISMMKIKLSKGMSRQDFTDAIDDFVAKIAPTATLPKEK